MALLLVLWVMVVLSSVAMQMNFSSRLRTKVTINTGVSAQTMYFARAGVEGAISDLVDGLTHLQPYSELHGRNLDGYRNAPIGDGTYTLFAGLDGWGEPVYGLIDESGRINLNSADTEMLSHVPGFSLALANAFDDLKQQQPVMDINDLLLLENVDALVLYGEDQNRNGLLDANEDDGDGSWPHDNQDGLLEEGLAQYLTTWSASRNVSMEGTARIDLSSADASVIAGSLSGVSEQEAEAIVAHRENGEFGSVFDLLDVELGSDDEEGNDRQKAFSMADVRALADLVTVSDDETLAGLININSASEEVLACLPGVELSLARAIVQAREGMEDGFATTLDLMDVERVSDDLVKELYPKLTARSDVFTVRSFGVLQDGQTHYFVRAVLDRTGSEVSIRYWEEQS